MNTTQTEEIKVITKEQLERSVKTLRNTIVTHDFSQTYNIIFFNKDALFEYLCDIPLISPINSVETNTKQETVSDALEEIAPFLPMTVPGKIFHFPIEEVTADDIEKAIQKGIKMDFVETISSLTTTEPRWFALLNACETIRTLKVKEIGAAGN